MRITIDKLAKEMESITSKGLLEMNRDIRPALLLGLLLMLPVLASSLETLLFFEEGCRGLLLFKLQCSQFSYFLNGVISWAIVLTFLYSFVFVLSMLVLALMKVFRRVGEQ